MRDNSSDLDNVIYTGHPRQSNYDKLKNSNWYDPYLDYGTDVINTARHRWNNVNPSINAFVRGVGAAGTTYLGAGGYIGSEVADKLHRAFKTVTGYGDYYINGVKTLPYGDSVPTFKTKNRDTVIMHREFIKDIKSAPTTLAFQVESFSLNPGLSSTFPWLAQVAASYEEYEIKGMIFEYKSTSSDSLNSTNTSLGTVSMATQYNVLSAPFTTKQEMENYEFGCSTRPSENLQHMVECKPGETPSKHMFLRSVVTPPPTISDLRLYDHGLFSIATSGVQGTNQVLGELWVTYKVKLMKPRLGANIVPNLADFYSISNWSGGDSIFGGSSADVYRYPYNNFGTVPVYAPQRYLQIPTSYTGPITVMIWAPSISMNPAWTITPSNGAVAYNVLDIQAVPLSSVAANKLNSADTYTHWATFYCTNGGRLTFSGGVPSTTIGTVKLTVAIITLPKVI